ncbi:dephospho-CoA kinase [Paenibacillus sp. IITD108]|uniref:dephospho-CoA kinase n=1 Tax=Paenibacillus sp. IITD108 TaxID=3116649 RepID=UPI002F3E575C
MIIGLTGGIASGKSTVASLLAKHGVHVVDADQVAREIVEPGKPALEAIASAFGQAILQKDGSLNRGALGQIVFQDQSQLKKLEAITHPAIREQMQSSLHRLVQQYPQSLIAADIPLLYETKQEQLYEGIMVVYVPEDLQIQRLMERNAMEKEEAERRVALQMDIEQKRQRADWVIDNSGSIEQTEQQVVQFLKAKGFL